ncbi:PREDICTED: leucine-rich repeat serine/threonine-protein kinase 2-like [Thamnophis sirtalis]|uniref:Leucine-rich repeat serine/threonine-protein kinase 2-like n=1 Tax=Thamnophis sirtalis TaxID=35019 RepID=A0A6I9Z489_9SAUR|nr:PREDICTED: leucine-rich repeat serine/threonine-protein kinase 2-like [Thamnophis sirtalis]
MLNNEELEFHQAPENLLGDGGFGSVYRAVYAGEEVAVKVFNKHTSLRLLRQELTVLCHLHHPSLVFLMAAAVRPRMLVMELAPKGSLDRLLQQENAGLTRTLQHRIALHVADGLRYLHSSMIIYRDLKPHNVLLFTLYPNSAVIAKIADYGISQYCCRMGIKTSEGTPGFRAPEVARGNVIYNQQADVYSFGLLLYDILTAGGRILEGIKFPNEFDELAIHGKLPGKHGIIIYGRMLHRYLCPDDTLLKERWNGKSATPLRTFLVGSESTPLMCLSESNCSSDRSAIWGGCGSKILSLSSDLSTHKLIETKTSHLLCHKDYCNANIISIAVDKFIYLAKKESYFVEIWDKKTEKLCELIDCVHLLKAEVPELNTESKQKLVYPGRVKSLCLQKNTALWVGTGGGHLLLLDLSTRLPIWIIHDFCRSVRFMMTAHLGTLRNVVLVLGYSHEEEGEDGHIKGIPSSVSIWDVNLPHEVQNLKKHIVMRQALAEKMKQISLD